MGPVLSILKKKNKAVVPVKKQEEETEEEEVKRRDGRRRNSLVSDIFMYIENQRLNDPKEMFKVIQPELDKRKKKNSRLEQIGASYSKEDENSRCSRLWQYETATRPGDTGV